ncbi:MAG: hypothetical protein ACRECV_00915 [Xanthobacteraceae bacterium]
MLGKRSLVGPAAVIAFVLLASQAMAQANLPAAAAKPGPSLLTGQPNAQQAQPPGTPPAAAATPAAAPGSASNPPPPQPLKQPAAKALPGPPSEATPLKGLPPLPGPQGILRLVRSTLIGLNDADLSGDYAVLYALAAPSLQHDVSTAKLAASFKAFRAQKIDIAAITVLTPAFVQPPTVGKDGFLRVAGIFPSRPLQLRFSMAYQFVDGSWRLAALAANAEPVEAGAQSTSPAQPSAAAKAAKPVVASKSVRHRARHKPAPRRRAERRIWSRYPAPTTNW